MRVLKSNHRTQRSKTKTNANFIFYTSLKITLMLFPTSHAGQWSDFTPACIVLACGVSRTAQCIPFSAIEDTSCSILDVGLRAWRWHHCTMFKQRQLRANNRCRIKNSISSSLQQTARLASAFIEEWGCSWFEPSNIHRFGWVMCVLLSMK